VAERGAVAMARVVSIHFRQRHKNGSRHHDWWITKRIAAGPRVTVERTKSSTFSIVKGVLQIAVGIEPP
jgi:hypothetical protein